MKRIGVFCGSSSGRGAIYADSARELGRELCRQGLGLVFGGGHIGLMGVLADTVLAQAGEVIGVIPQVLVERELAHDKVADMRIVGNMHERKALMAELSDAFIALPGGFGTADELFEMLTWNQLKLQNKPLGLLNVAAFFDSLLSWVDLAVEEGFIKAKHRNLVLEATTPHELLEKLRIKQ